MERHHHTPKKRAEQDYQQEVLFHMEREFQYKQMDSPELRYRYVNFTENLIARAMNTGADSMVFLDKSARPVAWLMHDLWPILARDGNGDVAPQPTIKFANIDREQWGHITGRSEDKSGSGVNVGQIDPAVIDSLRRTFSSNGKDLESDRPVKQTEFTNRDVMIVDEVSVSGDTLSIAAQIFGRAFPDARSIYSTHWMTPEKAYDKRSGVSYSSEVPVWYRRDEVKGRLVGNRDTVVSRNSKSIRQRMGSLFLSTRFAEKDERGVELRKEMRQLAIEVARGTMPVLPSHYRDDESEEYIMRHVNGVSFKEFATLRRESEKKNTPAFATLFADYKREHKKRS